MPPAHAFSKATLTVGGNVDHAGIVWVPGAAVTGLRRLLFLFLPQPKLLLLLLVKLGLI